MDPEVAWVPVPVIARDEELPAAFDLIFRHLAPAERNVRVTGAVELVRRHELDSDGILVVRAGTGICGAMVSLPIPGASALVWPPQAIGPSRLATAVEDALVRAALVWQRRRGAKLAQALLAPRDVSLAAPLERNGFTHVTGLWYLRHPLRPRTEIGGDSLTYQTYDQCDAAIFHRTLLETYTDTLDCPELGGVRTLEEVIAGHRGQGSFDPGRWWLAWQERRPVGVLLLTELPEAEGLDLSYLGIVPAARRRGIGTTLTEKALREAELRGAMQLTLAVDARNLPAWQLYRALGFEAFERREVYLAFLTDPCP